MTEPRLTHLVAKLMGNQEVISFSPAIARAIGDVEATVFLCQACYWQSIVGPGEWFYKLRDAERDDEGGIVPPSDASRQSWEWETALSRTRQESARRKLTGLGLLEEKRREVPAKLFYRVNLDRLTGFLLENFQLAGIPPTGRQKSSRQAGANRASKMESKRPSSNTKTTAEITQTTSTPSAVANPNADVGRVLSGVVVEKWAEPHKEVLGRALMQAQLNDVAAQEIADEFAGALEAEANGKHVGIRSKRGWLNHVIERYKKGDFNPDYGRALKARRQSIQRVHVSHVPYVRPSQDLVEPQLDIIRTSLKQARGNL
jgi:hypothetical protein